MLHKKIEKNKINFEGIVIGGHTAGYDLATFANDPINKLIKLLSVQEEWDFQKRHFLEALLILSYTKQKLLSLL